MRSTSDFTLGAASKSAAAREASASTDTSLPAGVYRIRISTDLVETTTLEAACTRTVKQLLHLQLRLQPIPVPQLGIPVPQI